LALARDLTRWLDGKPAGVPVLPLHREAARAIRADLTAAGIPYATDEGVADFHALRGYYVGELFRAGASPSQARAPARPAEPPPPLKHYARVSAHDMRRVVDSLTAPAPRTEPAALAPTGTGRIGNPSSLPFPYAPQGTGCLLTGPDGSADATGAGR